MNASILLALADSGLVQVGNRIAAIPFTTEMFGEDCDAHVVAFETHLWDMCDQDFDDYVPCAGPGDAPGVPCNCEYCIMPHAYSAAFGCRGSVAYANGMECDCDFCFASQFNGPDTVRAADVCPTAMNGGGHCFDVLGPDTCDNCGVTVH